ncbi:hypothetical protein TKK_0013900 [Trichogramma kaykai]
MPLRIASRRDAMKANSSVMQCARRSCVCQNVLPSVLRDFSAEFLGAYVLARAISRHLDPRLSLRSTHQAGSGKIYYQLLYAKEIFAAHALAQQATQSSRPEERRLRSQQIPRYSSQQQSPKATEFDGIHSVRTSFGPTQNSRKQFIWVVHLFVVHNGGATVDQVALGAILMPNRISGGETERRLSEGQSTREIPQIFAPVKILRHQRKEETATVSKPLEGSRRANRLG